MSSRDSIRSEGLSTEVLPTASHGEGIFIYDTQGRRYLDGCAGVATVNIGHGHPHVLAAMRQQAEKITFLHRGAFMSEPAEALMARLSDLTGYPFVLLGNTGSDGVEAAQKLALQYWQEIGQPQRSRFLSHEVGYHGATLGALSLSGNPRRREVAESLLHRYHTLTPPYSYRYGAGDDDGTFARRLADEARRQIRAHGSELAGVVVEPVGGASGGALTPPDGYLPALQEICREEGTLLITDEVMTGMGRTGRLLAAERWGVRADIVILGKGLGAGYTPISAVLADQRVTDAIAAGTGAIVNGHTYSGNPLSAAVTLAVLDVVESLGLVEAAEQRGKQLRAGLDELAARHPLIAEVRGVGLLQGLELANDRAGEPVGALTQRLVSAARRNGLLIYATTAGINDAVLIVPPLTITDDEINLLLHLLDRSLTDVALKPEVAR